MGDHGSPYARFQLALKTGNLSVIRAAAAECPRIDLDDALSIAVVMREQAPQTFERVALRWLARYALEGARSLDDLRRAADAFAVMASAPDQALAELRQLAR